MKLGDIYHLFVEVGIRNDPRDRKLIEELLEERKKAFEKLDEDEKVFFDEESLKNPFGDTRIAYGDPNREIRGVIVGIDVNVGEVLLVDRLREKGEPIDLIISHHPVGPALTHVYEVMPVQADILARFGVPINVAEGMLSSRIEEIRRVFLPRNVKRAVDAARLLDIPLLCVHTPADNSVASYLDHRFKTEKPHRVRDVLKMLTQEEEYRLAKREGSGLQLVAGKEENRAGEILVDMTGGTEGPEKFYEALRNSTQIGTLVGMHYSEKHLEKAKENYLNVIIAGHMASDTLGMNILLDHLLAQEPLEVFEFSGFHRVSREPFTKPSMG